MEPNPFPYDPPPGGHKHPAEEQQDALRRLIEALAGDPAFEVLGDMEVSGWGAGQVIAKRGANGQVRYLRVTVEPWESDPPPGGPARW